MMGRHGNWNQATAALPAKLMLERVAYAGFSGIVISRGGYADTKLEDELAALTETRPFVSQDGRWSFYDIRGYVEKMRSGSTVDEWARRAQEMKSPPRSR